MLDVYFICCVDAFANFANIFATLLAKVIYIISNTMPNKKLTKVRVLSGARKDKRAKTYIKLLSFCKNNTLR